MIVTVLGALTAALGVGIIVFIARFLSRSKSQQ